VTFFYKLVTKKLKKTGVGTLDGFYWLQYSPNGGVQWLLPKPWTSSIRHCARYCTGAPLWPSKWPAKLVHFFIVVLFAVALAAAGAIQSK
jgi:hypothetical protein